MSIVVQKYGGSSVADVSRMKRVADRVMATRRAGHDVVVVVSAMGDTTDELLALARKVSPSPDRRELDMLLTAGERIAMALHAFDDRHGTAGHGERAQAEGYGQHRSHPQARKNRYRPRAQYGSFGAPGPRRIEHWSHRAPRA